MKNYKIVLIIAAVVIAVALLFVFAFQGVQNKAISLEEQITTAQSEIKIQEKRRADLIPNLVDCVINYANHEQETFLNTAMARGSHTETEIDEITTVINAVAEAYPVLQANENYKQLMTELATTENLIAQTRTNYNSWVSQYNTYVRKFPNGAILNMLGYERQNFAKLDYDVSSDAPTNLFD